MEDSRAKPDRANSSPKKAHKRSLVLFLIAACLFGGIAVLFIHRDPYRFLDEFHPKRVKVQPALVMPGYSGSSAKEFTMLVFEPDNDARVLARMKEELSAPHGFAPDNAYGGHGVELESQPHHEAWRFDDMARPIPGKGQMPDEGAYFLSGPEALGMQQLFAGPDRPDLNAKSPAGYGCIVIVIHQPTWAELQIRKVMRFLHLN